MRVHMHDTVEEHSKRIWSGFWGKYVGFAITLFGIMLAFSTNQGVRNFSGILILIGVFVFIAYWTRDKFYKKKYGHH